jgi:hypothetical protein
MMKREAFTCKVGDCKRRLSLALVFVVGILLVVGS